MTYELVEDPAEQQERPNACTRPDLAVMSQEQLMEANMKVYESYVMGMVTNLESLPLQKIHNMLAGVDACDARSTYVLFLDDDVRLHRNTIGSLVSSMEANSPEMFLSNGFPFDLPPARGVNFPSYMTMAFHMVLLIAFSHPGEWTKNVWGGCMIVRRSSFANDEHGCRSKYERGGYSDDLILAALCDEFKRTVGAPADCVFPQHIEHTWTQWWNLSLIHI